MKLSNALAIALVSLSMVAAPMALGQDTKKVRMDDFMKSCGMDKDGMMSKAEMVKHMEKMFDKMDTRKMGKLDKKQTEEFLKQLTAPSGS